MSIFNTPSGVQVATNTNWIASNALYDMRKPENDTTEVHPWGNQDFTGLIEMFGGKHAVSQILYRHFEEDRLHQIVLADYVSGNTGSANDTIVYNIATTDEMLFPPTTPVEPFVAIGSGFQGTQIYRFPVRVGDILEFPTTGAQGIVTSVTPTAVAGTGAFTVVSTNGIAQGATVTATDQIINMGPTVGEGADMPLSYNFREAVYTGMCEQMADAHTTTGRAMAEATWVDFTWKGKTEPLWWFKGQEGTYKRFRNHREVKYVAGQKVVSATGINAYDASLTRTEGLIPYSTSYNALNTFNTNVGLTLEDWQTIFADQFDKNAGSSEYVVVTSITNRRAIESFIRTEMKAGGVQYGAFKGGEKQAVNFGFDSFQTLGYTSHLMTYQLFNNPTLLGAVGHKYHDLSVFIPTAQDMFALGEKKEKVMVPSMRINYMQVGGYNREWEEFLTGGANGVYTETIDRKQVNFRSDSGMEFFGSNRFGALQGVNS
jgi:hypothetical protein